MLKAALRNRLRTPQALQGEGLLVVGASEGSFWMSLGLSLGYCSASLVFTSMGTPPTSSKSLHLGLVQGKWWVLKPPDYITGTTDGTPRLGVLDEIPCTRNLEGPGNTSIPTNLIKLARLRAHGHRSMPGDQLSAGCPRGGPGCRRSLTGRRQALRDHPEAVNSVQTEEKEN